MPCYFYYDTTWRRPVKNLGGPGLRPPLSLLQSSFVPSLSWTLKGVWAEPAHPLPNILMQFIQSNSLRKSTLMFNVLQGTEISVHAEFSHCRQNWYYGLQAMYSSMALNSGGSVHIWTPTLPESEGVRTPEPHRITATVINSYIKISKKICMFLAEQCVSWFF